MFNPKNLGRAVVVGCLLLTNTLPLYSQPFSNPQNEETIQLSTDLVVLDAFVVDQKTGQPINRLQQSDFELYENDVKQEITHFSQDKLPLSLVLVLDVSGSMNLMIDKLKNGISEVLSHLRPDDEVAIVATASQTQVVQGFTKDKQKLQEVVRMLDNRAFGSSGIILQDGLWCASQCFNQAVNPISRRSILVISDDYASMTSRHSTKETLTAVLEAGITVCGLKVRDELIIWIGPASLRYLIKPGTMKTYADPTGGEVAEGKAIETVAKASEILDRLRLRYSFGYTSSNPKTGKPFRRLRLKIRPEATRRFGKLAIKHKKGYFWR